MSGTGQIDCGMDGGFVNLFGHVDKPRSTTRVSYTYHCGDKLITSTGFL